MPVSLTIRQGKDLGRQFSFDQPEVSIGRTAENDVVLEDAGVSRRHVVIRNQGGRFYAQDMGSANGTEVNGSRIVEEQLRSGDTLAVGPVVFAIEIKDAGATRILDASKLAAPPSKAALTKTRANGADPQLAKKLAAKPPSKGTAAGPVKGGALSPRKVLAPVLKAKGARGPLSASERARLRRENAGPLGRIKLFLMDKPPAVRFALLGAAGLLVVLLVVAIVRAATPKPDVVLIDKGDHSRDHFPLVDAPQRDVYGFGETLGVTVPTRDALHLDFEYSETIPMVYYLSFESLGIDRKDEVDLSLNGQHLANVTPGLGDYAKAQRIRLPKKYLRAGITNEITFENTVNTGTGGSGLQAGVPNETWAISKIQLIMKPVPGCANTGECQREAKRNYDLADGRLSMKEVAAGNRYEASQQLQKSVLFLENVEPKPELYNLALQAIRDVERELDSICSKTMLAGMRFEQLNDRTKALREYKNGLLWFPGGEHPCRAKLVENIERFGEAAASPIGN